jgi:hypothetical protein
MTSLTLGWRAGGVNSSPASPLAALRGSKPWPEDFLAAVTSALDQEYAEEISKSASSSALASTRCSRMSRTNARADPRLLDFTADD